MHIQGLRVIVVVVQAGAVKILYVSSSNGGAQEKWKTGWNSVYQQNKFLKIDGFLSFTLQ
jgi:hypothetical protein